MHSRAWKPTRPPSRWIAGEPSACESLRQLLYICFCADCCSKGRFYAIKCASKMAYQYAEQLDPIAKARYDLNCKLLAWKNVHSSSPSLNGRMHQPNGLNLCIPMFITISSILQVCITSKCIFSHTKWYVIVLVLSYGHHQVMSLVVHTSTWSPVIWLTQVQVSPWNFFNFVTLALQIVKKRNLYKLNIDPFFNPAERFWQTVDRWWVHGHLVLQNLKTGSTLHKLVVDYQCWIGYKWTVQQINFIKFLSTLKKISRTIVASLSWSFHIIFYGFS